MEVLVIFFAFLFGLLIGSFVNVLVLRYNTGRGFAGRSSCPYCNKTLGPRELIPVLSFLLLHGRCAKCASRLSIQYPIVELSVGAVFALSFTTFGFADVWTFIESIYWSIIGALFVAIALYDIKHYIIPDLFVFALGLFALPVLFFDFSLGEFTLPTLSALLAGPIIAIPIFLLWFATGGRAMGFGDVKLALVLGWLFGISGGVLVLLFSFWVGAGISILLIFFFWVRSQLSERRRHFTMKSAVPFAPYLLLGALIVLYSGLDLWYFIPIA